MKHLIIYGSSGGQKGKTWELTSMLQNHLEDAELINLSDYSISFFDYSHKNKDDDFYGLAQKMLASDGIIFATPVYWYAMSAQLKVFFDRLSDLITIRKEMGRKLAGKFTAFIATGHDEHIPEGFDVPFKRTSEYLDMLFKGQLYVCTNSQKFDYQTVKNELTKFVTILSS
jgi:multimeric flavodoxin WrbA